MQHNVEVCRVAIGALASLSAEYNGSTIELHPHQLVERNGATYLRAINPAKTRRADEPPSLGMFHLAGLANLRLTGEPFEPMPVGDLAAARPEDRVIATV